MSLDAFKLDGRVALITGGNRGLGFALAQALAEAGANVVVTGRQQERAVESAATLARATGQRTMGLMVDVTDAQQIESMVQAVVKEFGRIDILINNAGINIRKPVEELEWAAHSITVNALCPGPFATELNIPVMNNPQANQFFLNHIALGRWGRPEELGGVIVFLASDASSFMTGAALVVDGGWTAE